MTTTLKILWREQQDMRRVQVVAANQALANADGRAIRDWNALTYQDLRDYVLLVFPEIKQQQDLQQNDLLLYYTDDDDEQVRITNDAELAEAFRLMEEIASMAGKSALVKITLVTKPKTQQQIEADQMPVDAQQKKTMDLFIDLSKIIEQWDAGSTANSSSIDVLKRDLVSLLHEPGCQDALTDIMSTPRFATLLQHVADEFRKGADFNSCIRAASVNGEFDEIAKILLLKCPHARMQVERILQVIQEQRCVQALSNSDAFEPVMVEETKVDQGPIVAEFEADVTCPDGALLAPSQPFDKVWRIKNGGPTSVGRMNPRSTMALGDERAESSADAEEEEEPRTSQALATADGQEDKRELDDDDDDDGGGGGDDEEVDDVGEEAVGLSCLHYSQCACR
ncbi:hypothetical protein ATCC90586_004280 [Pythium insidiosum]|nr:hypothetical protein ATCC90586_004280 [Pythium insidiosum]